MLIRCCKKEISITGFGARFLSSFFFFLLPSFLPFFGLSFCSFYSFLILSFFLFLAISWSENLLSSSHPFLLFSFLSFFLSFPSFSFSFFFSFLFFSFLFFSFLFFSFLFFSFFSFFLSFFLLLHIVLLNCFDLACSTTEKPFTLERNPVAQNIKTQNRIRSLRSLIEAELNKRVGFQRVVFNSHSSNGAFFLCYSQVMVLGTSRKVPNSICLER